MAIEQRVEARAPVEVDYAHRRVRRRDVRHGKHRSMVGGLWEDMGTKQLEFLTGRGLCPEHRFIDVGCGSLRLGRQLVGYLEPGHYYGIDVNAELIAAGYRNELDGGARDRLPEANLRATDRFDCDFGVAFDMGIAQSIFSHLSLNQVRLCLARVAKVMTAGGRFYVTYFEQPDDVPVDAVIQHGRRAQYTERNVFWYYRRDLAWAAEHLPWEFRYLGSWGHPRGQVMAEYTRTG